MTARATSKAAFIELNESGKATSKRIQVMWCVAANPGASRLEVSQLTGIPINSVCGRVNELIAAGTIKENGCKHDSGTWRSVNMLYMANQ